LKFASAHGIAMARAGLVALLVVAPVAVEAQTLQDLQNLSIEDLGNLKVTSVSKRPQSLSHAAAAVYVITHDDIVRSGATSIPEILRLAPNLQVAQMSPSSYVITARGFSGNVPDQFFSDKLLVLVDGRSVYSPLYSGVYWDTIDVLPDDIERIEVISGPGATLWGANAVNGVINITTRKTADTQGGLIELGTGTEESLAALQYGGRIDDDLTYRVYGKDVYDRSDYAAPGVSARDGWYKPQGGFRIDWTPPGDAVTLQGDIYAGAEDLSSGTDTIVSGGNVEATWQHDLAGGSTLQVLSYFDDVNRETQEGGGAFALQTYDLEVQENIPIDADNNFIWGVGERADVYAITDRLSVASSLIFMPPDRTLNLADAFAQDEMKLTDQLTAIVGIKLEDDPYSGVAPMPTVRLSWQPDTDTLLWAAISRAVRSPTPFDVDVVEKLGPTPFLTGNPGFAPEEVTAYELGYRGQLSDRATLSVSTFYNVYDDLKSIEASTTPPAVLMWGNKMRGDVYGVEAWATYQLTDWWRFNAGMNLQHESLRFAEGSLMAVGAPLQGNDPHEQAQLRSSMNLPHDLTFDADLRYVGPLPDPHLPGYIEMNSRLGWRVTDRVELSLSGFNLLHPHHVEFIPGDEIPRSVFIETQLKL
jgi:iron complex outermembrane receptor protein